MGHAAGRLLFAGMLVLATELLLVTQDAPRPQPGPEPAAVALRPMLTASTAGWGRDYFVARQQVVPFGSVTLRLPILMYHYIRKPPSTRTDLLGYRLSVSPEDFKTQMDWLFAHHYHPVNFDQVRAYMAGAQPLPSRPIVITLDDGYQDLYTTAFPVLQAHAFTAVAYIVTGFVDRPRYVTREQVLQMDRSGIEIASHTVDHADLARSGIGLVTFELQQSKRWLEALLRHPVLDFAYPSGKYTLATIQVLRQSGYDTAVIEDGPSIHTTADRYLWGRVRVGGGENLQDFVANLGASMPSVTHTSVDIEPS